jgi:hypothetical protein
MAAKLYDIIMV